MLFSLAETSGNICRGILALPDQTPKTVQIETIKSENTFEVDRLNMLSKVAAMSKFDNPNVVFLEGISSYTSPMLIVMEYMQNGSLHSFVKVRFTITFHNCFDYFPSQEIPSVAKGWSSTFYAVGKQPSIPLINLGKNGQLN